MRLDGGITMFRTRVTAVLAALLVPAVVAPLGAASAQTVSVKDGSGDTWEVFWDPNVHESETYTQAGSVPNADVTKMTVSHTRKRITVTATYVELVQDDAYKPDIREWFRLAGGGGAMLNIFVHDSWSEPEVFFWKRPLQVPWASRQRARCSGVTSAFDFDRNTWTTKLPTSCLGSPTWVQFHGATSSWAGAAEDATQIIFTDNAHSDAIDERLTAVSEYCFSQCEGWTAKIRRTR